MKKLFIAILLLTMACFSSLVWAQDTSQQDSTPATPPAATTPADTNTSTEQPAAPVDTNTNTEATPASTCPAPEPQNVEPVPSTPTSQGAAFNLPNISVIGNLKGSLANNNVDQSTNRKVQMQEMEVVIGDKIYPGVSGNLVLTVGGEKGSTVQAEEAYIAADQLFSNVPIGARAGIVRLPFGKANPQHEHALPYADTPAVLQDLLGDFRGNGAEIVGVIPTHSKLFLQAQIGQWVSVGDPGTMNPDLPALPPPAGGNAPDFGDKALTLGRLWASLAAGDNNEFELGTSGAFGQAETQLNGGTPDINIIGLDATWRHYMSCERRFMLMTEALQRTDGGSASHGYYILGTYRPDHDYEFGSRYDWSQFANNSAQHESYISVFATRYLSEMTFFRLQGKTGTNADGQHVNEVIAQLVFGFGPHTHPLQ